MLRDKPIVDIDISEFVKSAQKHIGRDWPIAIVGAFAQIADEGAEGVRALTGRKFKLHSEYITRGIKSIPNTPAQLKASQSALKQYGDFIAAVYLRGATDPKRSMRFMAHHETGMDRMPQDTWIATPLPALERKSFRTGRGRVRKRWKPSTLLKRFKEVGSKFSGQTTTNRGLRLGPSRKRLPGSAFMIIGVRGTPVIARRITRGKDADLEFLYSMNKRADIKKGWGFVDTVALYVNMNHERIIRKAVRRMPSYAKR